MIAYEKDWTRLTLNLKAVFAPGSFTYTVRLSAAGVLLNILFRLGVSGKVSESLAPASVCSSVSLDFFCLCFLPLDISSFGGGGGGSLTPIVLIR